EEIAPGLFEHYVEAGGSVEAVREAFISPEISGQITAIYVKEGDKVQKGQLLAQLNTQVTRKSIEEVQTSLKLATDLFQRQQRLWDQKIGSEIQYLEAKNNKESLENRLATLNAQLDMARVVSPVSGVVEQVAQKNGELAMPGMSMIHVINLDELFVKADVSEALLPYIRKGDEIVLKFPSYPDFSRKLRVDRIGSNINPGNRTFEVQVKFDNTDGAIKPNMMASLLINDYRNEQALIIPSRLIKEDLKGKYIYIARSNSPDFIAQKVYIQAGRSFLGRTEVTSGLSVGDKIIQDGFNRVSDGVYLSVDSVKTAK
ncbi:efflux RND transporter periplasmic adaptor subunit, partial [Lentimicrobium sp.]